MCCVHDASRRSFHLIIRLFSFSIVAVVVSFPVDFSIHTHTFDSWPYLSFARSFSIIWYIHLSNGHRWVCLFRPTHNSCGRYGREWATWVSWCFVVQLGFYRFRNEPLLECGNWISMEINRRDLNRNFISPHITFIEIFIIIENYMQFSSYNLWCNNMNDINENDVKTNVTFAHAYRFTRNETTYSHQKDICLTKYYSDCVRVWVLPKFKVIRIYIISSLHAWNVCSTKTLLNVRNSECNSPICWLYGIYFLLDRRPRWWQLTRQFAGNIFRFDL